MIMARSCRVGRKFTKTPATLNRTVFLSRGPVNAKTAQFEHLGLILQEKGRFYEAAIEWTLARRLAPAAIEPSINLMRLYTQVGWTKEAQRESEQAFWLDPSHPDVLGQLALLSLRSGVSDARLDAWLERLAREDDEAWRAWARQRLLARRPEPQE